jgi:hypothetical protein
VPAVVGSDTYKGGVLLPDGRVVLVPSQAAAVGLYVPATTAPTSAYSLSQALSRAMNALLLPYVNKL